MSDSSNNAPATAASIKDGPKRASASSSKAEFNPSDADKTARNATPTEHTPFKVLKLKNDQDGFTAICLTSGKEGFYKFKTAPKITVTVDQYIYYSPAKKQFIII